MTATLPALRQREGYVLAARLSATFAAASGYNYELSSADLICRGSRITSGGQSCFPQHLQCFISPEFLSKCRRKYFAGDTVLRNASFQYRLPVDANSVRAELQDDLLRIRTGGRVRSPMEGVGPRNRLNAAVPKRIRLFTSGSEPTGRKAVVSKNLVAGQSADFTCPQSVRGLGIFRRIQRGPRRSRVERHSAEELMMLMIFQPATRVDQTRQAASVAPTKGSSVMSDLKAVRAIKRSQRAIQMEIASELLTSRIVTVRAHIDGFRAGN